MRCFAPYKGHEKCHYFFHDYSICNLESPMSIVTTTAWGIVVGFCILKADRAGVMARQLETFLFVIVSAIWCDPNHMINIVI